MRSKHVSLTERKSSDTLRSRPKSKAVKTNRSSFTSYSSIRHNNSSTRSVSRSNSRSKVRKPMSILVLTREVGRIIKVLKLQEGEAKVQRINIEKCNE